LQARGRATANARSPVDARRVGGTKTVGQSVSVIAGLFSEAIREHRSCVDRFA